MLNPQTTLYRAYLITVLPGLVLMLSGCGSDPNAIAPAAHANMVEVPPIETVDSPEAPATSVAAEADNKVVPNNARKETEPPTDSAPASVALEPSTPAGVETAAAPAFVENEHDKWVQNFEQAKAIAQREGKDILMDFTGSDWCGWCIRLHREVFQYQTFHDYADENLVLLELDFPRDKSRLTEDIIAQNDKLQAQFGIEGFPTILLLDADGRPYGKTGYQEGGPEMYVEHLTVLQEFRRTRDAGLKEAAGLEGIERAKKLDDVLASLEPGMIFPAYETEIAQIIALDVDNAAGLKEPYLQLQLAGRFQHRFGEIQGSLRESADVESILAELRTLEQEFAEYPDGKKQSVMTRMQILNQEGRHEDVLVIADELLNDETCSREDRGTYQSICYSMQRQLKRNDDALATLDAMIELAGDSGDDKAQMLVNKSEFLISLDRIAEGRQVFELAKQAAVTAQVRSALSRIERQLFADVETNTPAGEPDPAKNP